MYKLTFNTISKGHHLSEYTSTHLTAWTVLSLTLPMSLRTSVMGGLAGVTGGRVSAVEEASLWESRLAENIWNEDSSQL